MIQLKVHYGTDPRGQGFFWPASDQKRGEYFAVKRTRPAEAQSVYQCKPGAREGSIFLESDFAYYDMPQGLDFSDLAAGVAHPGIKAFIARGHGVGMGWDTAFEATTNADNTVAVPALLVPCSSYHCDEDPLVYGECEPHFDVLILDMYREQLDWGGLVGAFRVMNRKWEPQWHVVEKRGSGISLVQSMTSVGVNVEGVEAIESKRQRAIQGVGAGSVQGWFRQHRVLFPKKAPWLRKMRTELKDFTGVKDAADDIVDAIVHLVVKSIQLSSVAGLLPTDWTVERVDGMMVEGVSDQVIGALDPWKPLSPAGTIAWLTSLPMASDDVFGGHCGRCESFDKSFCSRWNRNVTALELCDYFEQKAA